MCRGRVWWRWPHHHLVYSREVQETTDAAPVISLLTTGTQCNAVLHITRSHSLPSAPTRILDTAPLVLVSHICCDVSRISVNNPILLKPLSLSYFRRVNRRQWTSPHFLCFVLSCKEYCEWSWYWKTMWSCRWNYNCLFPIIRLLFVFVYVNYVGIFFPWKTKNEVHHNTIF